jgi:hypothetical protein
MKTKCYRYGKVSCKATSKAVGKGWETTFYFDGKPIFVGNFIHTKEANLWWSFMNREIACFARKYTTGCKFPVSWVSHFLKSHLYKEYYTFLDKMFVGYHREYRNAFMKDFRHFKASKKHYLVARKAPTLKVA